VKVELGDGYYSFDLPPDEPTPERLVLGALTWRYDGQEVYRDEAESPVADRWVVPDEVVGTDCWGNSCTGGYTTGPKGSSIRTWVLNNTP
jgi:hypothetical protein